jgi:hypothetical protein
MWSNWVQGKNVLKKEPMGKDVDENDMFSFNEGFTSKLYKIKIGTISAQKETEPEKAETRHKVRKRLHVGHRILLSLWLLTLQHQQAGTFSAALPGAHMHARQEEIAEILDGVGCDVM